MIKMGADPEFLILGPNKKPVPAHRFFPDKENKIEVAVKGRGMGKLFRDGYSLEINVPPANCRSVLVDSMRFMLVAARRRLPPGYTMTTRAAWKINLKDLKGAPLDVQEFGCDAALDAYTGEEVRAELDGPRHPMRYGGGHMHFSVTPIPSWMKHFKSVRAWVLLMDQYVGIPLTRIYNEPMTYARRQYYGRAGEFRLQNYEGGIAGIEYRVPGPQIWNNTAVALMAFGVGRTLLERFTKCGGGELHPRENVRCAINTGVGLEKVFKPFPMWYRCATIQKAMEFKRFHTFNLGRPVKKGAECDFPGWSGWRAKMHDV